MDTDHNKGLISSSSSSSSTLPTPRPHRVGPKPLPEALRNQIIADHRFAPDGYEYPYSFYAHRIEPVECIDPDDPSSWENINDDVDEDEDDGLFFLRTDTRLFSPNQLPLVPGKKIYGKPVFELYYIQIIKLDPLRDFSSIFMKGTNTSYRPMIIYKRPEGKEIPLDKPLLLQNIFRPPSALNNIMIGLSNPASGGWALWYGPPDDEEAVVYGPCIRKAKDSLTESEALISYELIKSAATAELDFTFFNDKQRPITILSGGSISATTNGDPSTKRIIRKFEPSTLLQSKAPVVPVHRSVFGVPLHSCLHLVVNLKYFVGEDGPYNMEGVLIFPVPEKTESVEECITSHDGITKMRVKVSWWDSMMCHW